MSMVAFGRTVELVTARSTTRRQFRIGLEAIEKGTGRLSVDPDVQYDGDGVSFRRGDVLFGKLRPNLRKAWLADTDGDAVGDFHVYRPNPRLMTSRYLAYLILSQPFLEPVVASVYGAKMPRADWGAVRNIKVWVPELNEQRAIADYLDRETAQIDAFIAKNEELLALLAERRAAVIGRAVTRGLSEAAPLSGDGPEWIGQVPAAWSVRPIKAEYTVVVGKMLNESKSEGDSVPYVRAANIQPHGLDLSDIKEMKATVAERTSLALRAGDVVFVEGGGGYGRSDFLTEDLDGWVFQNHVIRLRPRRRHDGRFLNYWLQHIRRIGRYEALSAFATIPNVSGDKLGRIEMPVPPIDEQRRIVAYIEESTKRIDDALNVVHRGIQFAKERRAALISAAVTGKIDVRETA
jgi:type I restriction enzyme S subunit